MVPTHSLISAKDANEMLHDMHLKHDNLPKIYNTDPQAVLLGAKPGDIIKVKRHDYGSAYESYRLVVEE